MQTELDSLTIKDFEARYGIARSNMNNRIAGLKQKGYDLEPEERNNRNLYRADQLSGAENFFGSHDGHPKQAK